MSVLSPADTELHVPEVGVVVPPPQRLLLEGVSQSVLDTVGVVIKLFVVSLDTGHAVVAPVVTSLFLPHW